MELADLFIGKPGPGSISEALLKRLPVIVQRNAWTMAHERYNTEWLEERGFGLVVRSFSDVGKAVRKLLEPERYREIRKNVEAYRNRAVFEIPDMLERILEESAKSWTPLPATGSLSQWRRDTPRSV
jgi:1,2-diacylglycerol 3-beta-galactosyltransferase